MKKIILMILILSVFVSCKKPTIFILKDKSQNKFLVSNSIKDAFKKDIVNKKPLIVINGIPWEYDRKSDTVVLPLEKKEIQTFSIVNKNSSHVIYGSNAIDGAVIINAVKNN